MKKKIKKRLILVSNRLPFRLVVSNDIISLKQSDGGLVTALKSFFEAENNQEVFDEKIWIGSADFPQKRWEIFSQEDASTGPFKIEPLFIESKAYNKYYNGFCNATLWPLFHYFTSYVEFDEESFQQYEKVNQLFAEKIAALYKPGDLIWIHDYQLMLLPDLIRKKFPEANIGFFLHIPFPSYEIFRILRRPWKDKLLKGLLGANLIGFHTHEYVQHFLKTIRMMLGYDHEYRDIHYQNRVVKVDVFPLGIDFEKFNLTGQNKKIGKLKASIKKDFSDKKIIFSVDRLDYTKGLHTG